MFLHMTLICPGMDPEQGGAAAPPPLASEVPPKILIIDYSGNLAPGADTGFQYRGGTPRKRRGRRPLFSLFLAILHVNIANFWQYRGGAHPLRPL